MEQSHNNSAGIGGGIPGGVVIECREVATVGSILLEGTSYVLATIEHSTFHACEPAAFAFLEAVAHGAAFHLERFGLAGEFDAAACVEFLKKARAADQAPGAVH